jgi:nucleolar complex protein 2
MGKKQAKSTKKFIASGSLKKTIESRRKHKQVQKKLQGRRGAHRQAGRQQNQNEDEEDSEAEVKDRNEHSAKK